MAKTSRPKNTIVITGANGGLGTGVIRQIVSRPDVAQFHTVCAVRQASSATALHSVFDKHAIRPPSLDVI